MAERSGLVRAGVGAALRFVRANLRFIAIVAAIFAGSSTLVSLLALSVPEAGVLTMAANGAIQAFSYAALTAAVLYGAGAVRARWTKDGWRVWAAMAVVGFFLVIVTLVISIPVSIALVAGPLGRYASELQAAGADQQAVMQIMMRFIEENPSAVLAVMLFYSVIWLLITSRLYLAAPASVDAGRTLTFETWTWTKGAMLRITWARLMLLIPAYVLMFALTTLLGRVFGFNLLDGASLQAAVRANPVGLIAFELISSFVVMFLYVPLEAGLSASLYRGLKPANAQPATPPTAG